MNRQASPRRVAMQTIVGILRGIDNGKYFVKRGAINWINFDFTKHGSAIAVMSDSTDVGRCGGGEVTDGMILTLMSLEIATTIPPDDEPEINDEVLEDIYDDVEFLFDQLNAATDANGDSVILKLERNTASAIEFHDPEFGVQGIVVTFAITF